MRHIHGSESSNLDLVPGICYEIWCWYNIYFTGNFNGAVDFDPGQGTANLTTNGLDDAFIVKLDLNGNFVWVKQFGGTGSDKIWDIDIDIDGNIYTTGHFGNTVDFDPGPGNYPLTTTTNDLNCFISKLDKNGNFIFAKNFSGGFTVGESLVLDSSKNVYIFGAYAGYGNSIDFDPGPATYNISGGDLFTVKLDKDGIFSWAAAYLTQITGSFQTIYSDIAVDVFKNVYITGSFPFTVDFDPGPANYNATPIGSRDVYIHKLGQENHNGIIKASSKANKGATFDIYIPAEQHTI